MSSLEALPAHPAPLRADADSVMRVGSTRVPLDTLVGAFLNGCTAEEIVMKYPALDLTDVYATIAYYLWNRAEIGAFLAERERDGRALRDDEEARHPSAGIREMLLTRERHAS